MIRAGSGAIGGEQLLVLWAWLADGYVPVAHIVAETYELEELTSSALSIGRAATRRPRAKRGRKRAPARRS